jgi:hypothetical protein
MKPKYRTEAAQYIKINPWVSRVWVGGLRRGVTVHPSQPLRTSFACRSSPKQRRVANRWKLRAPQLRPPASRHPGFAQETTVGPKHDCFGHLLPACGCVQFLDCASSIGPLCLRQHGWDYFFFCAAAQHSDHQKGLAHQEGAYSGMALKAFCGTFFLFLWE